MIVLRFGLTSTTHAPRPGDPDSSWCGRPFMGRRKTPKDRERIEGVPTCNRCRMLLFWGFIVVFFGVCTLGMCEIQRVDAACTASCEPYLSKRRGRDCYCSTDGGGWIRPPTPVEETP